MYKNVIDKKKPGERSFVYKIAVIQINMLFTKSKSNDNTLNNGHTFNSNYRRAALLLDNSPPIIANLFLWLS